jgi:hypothetical protein
MFILDAFTVLIVTAITDVTLFEAMWHSCCAKNCMKYFTVTGHVNKNLCHKEIFVCVMIETVSGSNTLWFG